MVKAVTEPSLLLALQTYIPMSAIEKSRIDKVPLMTLLRPFGKDARERAQVTTEGG